MPLKMANAFYFINTRSNRKAFELNDIPTVKQAKAGVCEAEMTGTLTESSCQCPCCFTHIIIIVLNGSPAAIDMRR